MIFRLSFANPPSMILNISVDDFCEVVKEELPNADFFKSAGVRGGHRRTIIEATREYFYVITRNGSLLKYCVIDDFSFVIRQSAFNDS